MKRLRLKSPGALSSVLGLSMITGSVLIVATICLVSTGAFAIFSSTGVAATNVDSGTVKLSWNQGTTAQLNTPVGPLNPNDSIQSVSDLVNSGNVDLSTIQIAVTGTRTGSASDGLQLAIAECSVPWVGSSPNFRCDGVLREVSADRPVTGLINVPHSSALVAGGRDHLRFTYRLSESAPESMANSSGDVSLIATGIQRAGENR